MGKEIEVAIAEDVAKHIVDSPDRLHKLSVLLLLGISPKDAGEIAGYSPSYSKTQLYQTIKNSSKIKDLMLYYADKMPQSYKQLCQANLIKIAELESKIIDHLIDNPKDYKHYKEVVKQQKQSAGVLAQDQPVTQVINVKEVQNLIAAKQQQLIQNNTTEEVIEGEILSSGETNQPTEDTD